MSTILTNYKLQVIQYKLSQEPRLAQAQLAVSLHFIARYGFIAYHRHVNWINCILYQAQKEIMGWES
jgi:hypothetical protein